MFVQVKFYVLREFGTKWYIELFQINCALPHRGCQRYLCKKSGTPLAISQFCLENPEWEKSLEFRCMCNHFWKCVWKYGFLFKNPGNPGQYFTKKSLEIQPPLWGRVFFFWNSPFGMKHIPPDSQSVLLKMKLNCLKINYYYQLDWTAKVLKGFCFNSFLCSQKLLLSFVKQTLTRHNLTPNSIYFTPTNRRQTFYSMVQSDLQGFRQINTH